MQESVGEKDISFSSDTYDAEDYDNADDFAESGRKNLAMVSYDGWV